MTLARPLVVIYCSDAARFEAKVERGAPDECWPFTGALVEGYGSFRLGDRKVKAHRVAWRLWSGQGDPGAGMQLDHTCHVPGVCLGGVCVHRSCCNPAHLRIATPRENIDNSNVPRRRRRAATAKVAALPQPSARAQVTR